MILITGASSGIGEACARIFAAEGKSLLLLARRSDRLVQIQAELESKHSVEVQTFVLDVSDRHAVEDFFATQAAVLARVEVLINNAGLARGLTSIQDGELDDWEEMIDVNVKGLLYFTRGMLPHFIKKSSGHIVNLGSVAGQWVYPKGAIYCATKHAVHAISEAIRLDTLGTGIRVTEISPGMVETEFSVVRLGDLEKAKSIYAGMTPLTARDIAESVSWAVGRPRHVNIQEIVLFPTDQASPTLVSRKS